MAQRQRMQDWKALPIVLAAQPAYMAVIVEDPRMTDASHWCFCSDAYPPRRHYFFACSYSGSTRCA